MEFEAQKIQLQANTEIPPKKKKPQKPAKRYSNFFLTINTQKNLRTMDADEVDKLTKKFNAVIDEFYTVKLKDFIILKPSESARKYGLPTEDVPREELEKRIEKVRVQYVVEVGPESGKLHSHGLVAFTKRVVDTKLDYGMIKDWLTQQMGFTIYFKNVLYNNTQASLEEYIRKTTNMN